MDSDEEIFQVVHFAQWRQDSSMIVRNWLSDSANNPNISDEHAFSLLHWAVIGGSSEIVGLLLEHGARVNIMNAGGDTPLHLAAQLNRVDAAGLLLQVQGIMTSTPNAHGNTPLHYAAFFKCHNVAVLLAASGASLTVQNKDGKTPLDLAEGSPELVTELKDISVRVKSNTPSFAAPMNLASPGVSVTDGPVASAAASTVGLASVDLRDKISESRVATCWSGTSDGAPVVARSVHLRRRGPLAPRLAVQLLSETERLRAGRGTISHLNVLPLLNLLIDNHGAGEPLLLSRFQQLGSLYNILHTGSLGNRPKFVLDQRQTYRIALDIANGMEYLHGALQDTSSLPMPRFHLNSRNILLDIDANDAAQEPIARLYLAKSDLPGTSDPRVIRYPAWYAPEELIYPPHVVRLQPADMWSMGVILFELVTLCIPFADLSAVEIGIKVALEGARVHHFAKAPGISAHVERLLGICMNENPECRPSFDQIVPVFRRMVAAANANAPA